MNKFETTNCPCCKAKTYTVLWDDVTSWEHKGVFTIVRCSQCRCIYVNPRPTFAQMGKYYPAESYWGKDTYRRKLSAGWKVKREIDYAYLYDRILPYRKTGSLLDIGAGDGTFASKFKELGWNVNGVEFSKDAVRFAKRAYGVHLKVGDFLHFRFRKNVFDVITLNNVLEHLHKPGKTLQDIRKTLKSKGTLVITVPNVDGFGFRIFGKEWYALQPPRHLTHFSSTTLIQLLKTNGFSVTAVHSWYWIHNYASIFESFRLRMSPKFEKSSKGGSRAQKLISKKQTHLSIKKELGKVAIKVLTVALVVIGSLIRKSESITVIAKKA